MGLFSGIFKNLGKDTKISEKLGYISRKIPKFLYVFLPKWLLEMVTGFEAPAAHLHSNQIWVSPSSGLSPYIHPQATFLFLQPYVTNLFKFQSMYDMTKPLCPSSNPPSSETWILFIRDSQTVFRYQTRLHLRYLVVTHQWFIRYHYALDITYFDVHAMYTLSSKWELFLILCELCVFSSPLGVIGFVCLFVCLFFLIFL